MNPVYAGIAIAGWFLVLLFIERKVPLRERRQASLRRLVVNVIVSALAIGVAVAVVRPAADRRCRRRDSRVGLLQWLALPPAVAFCAGVLLLDLSFYCGIGEPSCRLSLALPRRPSHRPGSRRVHAFRFHFGEVALSAGFRVAQILVIGASPLTIAIYELVFQANTLFQHSNVRLPIGVERILNRALVTPRMHGIHHSMVKRHDMSNFSVVFAWWDRLFGTLRLNVPQQASSSAFRPMMPAGQRDGRAACFCRSMRNLTPGAGPTGRIRQGTSERSARR